MATIKTSIQLQDGVTSVIQSLNSAMNSCINSFETLQKVSSYAVNTTTISAARVGLSQTSIAILLIKQNIHEADLAQQQLNNQLRNSESFAQVLTGNFSNVAEKVANGLAKIMNLSDTVAQTTARFDLMNDGQQTTAELQEKIFQSAERTRGLYQNTADQVSKLGMQAGQAFSSNDELIAFTEQLNKTFLIAGTSAGGVDSAMSQITQSMAAGKLQGEGFSAILGSAPPIVANLQRYLQEVEGFPKSTTDNIKQLATDGVITAQVLKNAMFYAADETNRQFASMPLTFGQVWNSIQNNALMKFQPVLQMLNGVANSKGFASMVGAVITGLTILASVATKVFNEIAYISGLVLDNWSLIEPVVLGVAAAYVVYNAAAAIAWLNMLRNAAAAMAHTVVSWAETAAIIALEAAQYGLNAAMAMCPITWIIIAVIALIAIFYLAVAAINKWAGTSLSATGIIVGAFFWLGGMIYNVIAFAWNTILSFAEFLGNVFKNPTAATYNLFVTIWNGIVELVGRSINEIIGLINKLPGMELGFVNWGKGLATKMEIQKGVNFSPYQMDYSSGNFMKGYTVGKDLTDKLSFSHPDTGMRLSNDFGQNVAGDIANTAANTGKMNESLNSSTEDLKYMRDIAEQEVINRFTTAEIKIEMGGISNNVNSNMDLDGMVTYLKHKLVETVQTASEQFHKA